MIHQWWTHRRRQTVGWYLCLCQISCQQIRFQTYQAHFDWRLPCLPPLLGGVYQQTHNDETGDQKIFIDNPDVVKKTINKEDQYSHLLTIHHFSCLFLAFLHHNSQGMVINTKPGSNQRSVCDGSTKRNTMDTGMNNITNLDDKVEITFGDVKLLFYAYVYNVLIPTMWSLAPFSVLTAQSLDTTTKALL